MKLQRYFLTGLLALLPLVVTVYVLAWVYASSSGIITALLHIFGIAPPEWALPWLPVVGILFTFGLIVVVGMLATNIIGRQLLAWLEQAVLRFPGAGYIYRSVRQISNSFLGQQEVKFSRAALIEYPRKGLYSLCFVIQEARLRLPPLPEGYTVVLVPTSPVPASGMVVVVPSNDVMLLDISIEEALRYVVSAGFLLPEEKAKPLFVAGSPNAQA
ncbi:MAG: DUF502 domain-containing protein [Deinococcus sp.]|nr:DUF502 domain-containing protein [Deinococcus sp.]MCL5964431.1 DUF502 domain-containing protein [Deinococcus sp.]